MRFSPKRRPAMKEHLLVQIGKEKHQSRLINNEAAHFLDDVIENSFLNEIEIFPHAFVLASLMDRRITAEKAWHIPFVIKQELGTFDIFALSQIPFETYQSIFNKYSLHRFNDIQADIFFCAVQRIVSVYNGDVAKIWNNRPSSSKVVYEFLQFKGCGVKISTMIANILAREFHIQFSDYFSIDISPDVHVMRIMRRSRLVSKEAGRDSVIYKARELNPEYPGIIDYACWEIGRNWCKTKNPDCTDCPISSVCKKDI